MKRFLASGDVWGVFCPWRKVPSLHQTDHTSLARGRRGDPEWSRRACVSQGFEAWAVRGVFEVSQRRTPTAQSLLRGNQNLENMHPSDLCPGRSWAPSGGHDFDHMMLTQMFSFFTMFKWEQIPQAEKLDLFILNDLTFPVIQIRFRFHLKSSSVNRPLLDS